MSDVLIMDGSSGSTADLAEALRRRGHAVSCVDRADEAVQHLRWRDADLVVLPVSQVGRSSMALMDELTKWPGESSRRARPAVALFWEQDCDDGRGGPAQFGGCQFVAKSADEDETCRRLLACKSDDVAPLPVPALQERVA